MPGTVEPLDDELLVRRVKALAEQIRLRRKALGVSAAAAAEAAGMSRVTWHRIEKGSTRVTIAAWLNALTVLGLEFGLGPVAGERRNTATDERLPLRVRLADHPRLAAVAWQLPADAVVSARELWDIVRNNRRHLQLDELDDAERTLISQLETLFGESRP